MKLKKRYIASPLVLVALALTWNVALRFKTPNVDAETMEKYLHPEVKDPRHPIDVYQMAPGDGNTESDVIAKIPSTIYPEDKVRFLINPGYGVGTIVHIKRAMPVKIKDGKKEFDVRTWSDSVGDVLHEIRRPLIDLDKANFDEKEKLQPNMVIEVTRVSKIKVEQKESIPFETVTKDDPNEYRGVTKTTDKGENGERVKVYEITREDGEEVSRKLVKNEVTKKPKSKVIIKGTKIKVGKTQTGKATWYDLCCKKVASNTFKKGTLLRLTNLANGKQIEVTVDDTGGFDGNVIVVDLHPSLFQALGGTLGQGVISQVRAEEILNP